VYSGVPLVNRVETGKMRVDTPGSWDTVCLIFSRGGLSLRVDNGQDFTFKKLRMNETEGDFLLWLSDNFDFDNVDQWRLTGDDKYRERICSYDL